VDTPDLDLNMLPLPLPEADALVRSKGKEVSSSSIQYLCAMYFAQEQYYEAHSLLWDYREHYEKVLGYPLDSDSGMQSLLACFASFCQARDTERSIAVGIELFDLLVKHKYHNFIVIAMSVFVGTFGKIDITDIRQVMFGKTAISSALLLIERFANMDDELYAHVLHSFRIFPQLILDQNFYYDVIDRLVQLRNSKIKTVENPMFANLISLLQRTIALQISGIPDIENDDKLFYLIDGYNRLFEERICVESNYSSNTIAILQKLSDIDDAIREAQIYDPKTDIYHVPQDLSEAYHKAYDSLLDSKNVYIAELGEENGTILYTCHAITYLLCYFLHDVFSDETIEERFKSFEIDFYSIDVRRNVASNTMYFYKQAIGLILAYYDYYEDLKLSAIYGVKTLMFLNEYSKRVLFEQDVDALEKIISSNQDLEEMAIDISYKGVKEFPESLKLFYELISARNNFLYIAEQWTKNNQGIGDKLVHLNEHIDATHLSEAIPKDAVLVDIFFNRFRWTKSSGVDSRETSRGYAFASDVEGNLYLFNIGTAHEIQNAIYQYRTNRLDQNGFLKSITDDILANFSEKRRILLRTEGDFNDVSFLSLPHRDGVILDYFSVRNLASVYDVIYPLENSDSNCISIISDPYFGPIDGDSEYLKPGEHGYFKPLPGSQKEGEIIEELFKSKGFKLSHGSGINANIISAFALSQVLHYRLSHYSTHCIFDNKNDKLCLVLAGANKRTSGGSVFDDISELQESMQDLTSLFSNGKERENNGIVPEDELYKLINSGTDVAVFSCCESGKVSLELQNSLSGFIKHMMIADVITVIAPIETINDALTWKLWELFYSGFISNPQEDISVLFASALRYYREWLYHEAENLTVDSPVFVKRPTKILSEYRDYVQDQWRKWVIYSREKCSDKILIPFQKLEIHPAPVDLNESSIMLNEHFLEECGLAQLTDDEKYKILQKISEELEMRVGATIAEGMSDELLDEFDTFLESDVDSIREWLNINHPEHHSDPNFLQMLKDYEASEKDILSNYAATLWLRDNKPDYPDVVKSILLQIKTELMSL
jgi:hypothetical protein